MKRTDEEILDQIKVMREYDMLGFGFIDLVAYLSYEAALENDYVTEGVTKAEWKDAQDQECGDSKEKMIDYLSFAFDKAQNQRGISSERSIMHMLAWSWLSGDDELYHKILDAYENDYRDYGISILEMICDELGEDKREHGWVAF